MVAVVSKVVFGFASALKRNMGGNNEESSREVKDKAHNL